MQGVRLCSSVDQGESPRANWSVWLEGEPRAGQCLVDPRREAAGTRKSGCRFKAQRRRAEEENRG